MESLEKLKLEEYKKKVEREIKLNEDKTGLLVDAIIQYMRENSLNLYFLDKAVDRVKEIHYETAKF